jgi:putative transposase
MTRQQTTRNVTPLQALLQEQDDLLRPLVQLAVQEFLEAEMNETLGAAKGERTGQRLGYRSGYYPRKLITRVGTLELRVPQDRQGRFSTALFARYQRSEKALVTALVEMYVQGATRKIKAISEELCGHEFSASTVSELNAKLDAELTRFARQPLVEEYPYVFLDARYERVREAGIIQSRTVLVAIGINWDGRRRVLGVELAGRESASTWRDFLVGLKERGLRGVRLAISDQHAGLKQANGQLLPEAAWQRCCVHFLRNALDHLPRKADDDCLTELRWLYDLRDVGGGAAAPAAVAGQVGGQVWEAVRLGGGQHRGDLDVLPAAAGAPQASQEHQRAGTAHPGVQAADAGRADLPPRGQLPAAGARPGVRAGRGMAGRGRLSGPAAAAGSREATAGAGGLKPHPHLRWLTFL